MSADDRTITGTRSVFGHQARFRLVRLFPANRKDLHLRSIIYELLWFLNGMPMLNIYRKMESMRNGWADENGELGVLHGAQWTAWQKPNGELVNQINQVIKSISDNRMEEGTSFVWNPGELELVALPPCHALAVLCSGRKTKLSTLPKECRLVFESPSISLPIPF